MRKGIIQITLAVALMAISLWSLIWVFSSASLASAYCGADFSLSHSEFRCQQPFVAMILCVVFGLLGVLLALLGVKNLRVGKAHNKALLPTSGRAQR